MTLLHRLIAAISAGTDPGPFALLRRHCSTHLEVFSGEVRAVDQLADIPLPEGPPGPRTLAVVPYRQIAERGFDHVDDGAPLECLTLTGAELAPLTDVIDALPDGQVATDDGGFDLSDEEYASIVGQVLRDEIGRGAGANFVIQRSYRARVDPRRSALEASLTALRRLLLDERGAYWTFLVHTGTRILVGATPERHVSVADGLVTMNPISGTLRHPDGTPELAALLDFLHDSKEVDELYMVLDEELKMMAAVAEHGGQVVGPYLKEMSRLTHTEYLLAGRCSRDVREVLRETMFAPTVTGSPIENACRVITRYERRGRGYYGGVLALLGRDERGRQTLDAPILIRTAEISPDGRIRVPVGATLVRHSSADGEVTETHAKAAGVLTALGLPQHPADRAPDARGGPHPARVAVPTRDHPAVRTALAGRNEHLARFWLEQRDPGGTVRADLLGRRALIVDAEDTFTGMLAHQLRALGLTLERRRWTSYRGMDPDIDLGRGVDLVIVGPGPGDPTCPDDPKMVALRRLVDEVLDRSRPLLGVCLGHQILANRLGLPLGRRDAPYQGTQRQIDVFGAPRRVGFYSSFTAVHDSDDLSTRHGPVRLSRDTDGCVHALRGLRFAGVQFHPESVLSADGMAVLADLLALLLPAPSRATAGVPGSPTVAAGRTT